MDTAAVQSWFSDNKPDQVYLAAAKVGGIYANNSFLLISLELIYRFRVM